MRNNLELKLECDRNRVTKATHQYTTYPFRLSKLFNFPQTARRQAYVYLLNTSPGLLAGDYLSLDLQLQPATQLYFTDQSATKVHAMPQPESKARTQCQIIIGDNASLEYVPEPLILFEDSALEQTTKIELHPTGSLFWSEILLPGRLARGEYYSFRTYRSRLELYDDSQELWFCDANYLAGKENCFRDSKLFVEQAILANIVLVQPKMELANLKSQLQKIDTSRVSIASCNLPEDRGLLIRLMAGKTSEIKKYLQAALNCVRRLSDRKELPHIPK